LSEAFGYTDVYKVFPEELDDDMTERFFQTVFGFAEAKNQEGMTTHQSPNQ